MTREGAVATITVALYEATEDPPAPGDDARDWARKLLDALEPYVTTRQADALHWAADQHERVSATRLRRWAGLLADGRCSIRRWAEITGQVVSGPGHNTTLEE